VRLTPCSIRKPNGCALFLFHVIVVVVVVVCVCVWAGAPQTALFYPQAWHISWCHRYAVRGFAPVYSSHPHTYTPPPPNITLPLSPLLIHHITHNVHNLRHRYSFGPLASVVWDTEAAGRLTVVDTKGVVHSLQHEFAVDRSGGVHRSNDASVVVHDGAKLLLTQFRRQVCALLKQPLLLHTR
jgi:hypothetical protein